VITLAELVRSVAERRGDGIVVTSPGAASGALWAAGHHPATIYNMELAYASSVALGLAIAQPERPVIAIEGDGSLLAALPVLTTVARCAPANFTIVAVVNGVYGTGDNKTPTAFAEGADLAAVALALGWETAQVVPAASAEELKQALTRATDSPGPFLVVADVDPASYEIGFKRVRPGIDVVESAVEMRRYLAGG
jgi:thiamine pyrophosphate-dependent acetolactate synthase large subunit-like protein